MAKLGTFNSTCTFLGKLKRAWHLLPHPPGQVNPGTLEATLRGNEAQIFRHQVRVVARFHLLPFQVAGIFVLEDKSNRLFIRNTELKQRLSEPSSETRHLLS